MPFHARKIDIPKTDIWSTLFERPSTPFPDSHVLYATPTLPSTAHQHYTFSTLRYAAVAFGRGLRARYAFAKGDVLAIFSPNCIDTPAVTWGAHWAGGVVAPANPAYTVGELVHHLRDCGARVVVCTAEGAERVRAAVEVVEGERKGGERRIEVLVFGQRGEGREEAAREELEVAGRRIVDWRDVLDSGRRERGARTTVDPGKDLAFLVYSSGTTGLPKGVMLTHANVVSDLFMLKSVEGEILKWDRDRIVAVLPYYHIYGLQCLILLPCYTGVPTIVMPSFDLPSFCQIVQDHQITYAYIAPPVVLHLAKSPVVAKYDLRSLRTITSGAAPLSKDLILAVQRRLGTTVKQAYGLSETSPVTHIQKHWDIALGSNGPPLPNQSIKFVSPETGTEVPLGSEGELWIAGPNVFHGYLHNPTATRECTSGDGYFQTGDIGYADADGNLYITDRRKELIKYKGFQVAPAELEGVLAGCEVVDDVAVVGVFDERRASEVPVACVVLKKGVQRSEERKEWIVNWLQERVTAHKRLRGGVRWVDAVPKSASGKILRRVLREGIKMEADKEEKRQREMTKPKL